VRFCERFASSDRAGLKAPSDERAVIWIEFLKHAKIEL
jgi:hypothetical protein